MNGVYMKFIMQIESQLKQVKSRERFPKIRTIMMSKFPSELEVLTTEVLTTETSLKFW